MPEWADTVLAFGGAAAGAYVAIRIELRFVWRDIARLEARMEMLESGPLTPRRRWNDPQRPRVMRDP